MISVIACVSGRLESFKRHVDALAGSDIEYCLATWGYSSSHRDYLWSKQEQFSWVKVKEVSDDPYFPLPQAYNAALRMATSDIVVVLGSEVIVTEDLVAWAEGLDLEGNAWFAGCVNTADQRWLIGPEKHGAWPYCMAIRREYLERIGGWDEAFSDGVVFDDTDLGLRLIASGIDCRWDYTYVAVHQSHPRAHGKGRGEAARRNMAIVENRLNGYPIRQAWPCWWGELYTGKHRVMPSGDGIAEQAVLRNELRRRGYPIESDRNGLRRNAGAAAVCGPTG